MLDRGTVRSMFEVLLKKNKFEKLAHLVGFIIRICHIIILYYINMGKVSIARNRETVRNMLSFYSKNKFEKFVHLVGFIIRICHIIILY